jgi:asparagine synthase (glutamine-hydrolysing)
MAFVLHARSEEEIVQGVRKRLLEAVKIRLKADVPVAIYLNIDR